MKKKNQETTNSKSKKKKWKRILMKSSIIAGIIGAVGLATAVSANAYVISKYKNKILTVDGMNDKQADCIMVLGAKVRNDGSPSYMLQDRLEKGIELYQAGVSNRLLMTGDHGREEYDEVNSMKNYAVDQGIEKNHIFMDHAGFSTYESMYRAKEVFGVKSMVIVTQKYHMYRALYIANQLGIDAYGVCAEDIEYSNQVSRDIREVAARVKDIGTVMIGSKPEYLGEMIPISESGELTDDN